MESFPIMDLPRELRDQIVKQTICIPLEPVHPSPDIPRSTRNDVKSASWFGGQGVLYPSDALEPVLQPGIAVLSCVNRQLHAEVGDLLRSIPASVKHSYALDINLVEEESLFPFWTRVPVLTDRIEEVRASVHIKPTPCDLPGEDINNRSGFREGCGGPPLISWSFFSILERVLIAGPTYREISHDTPDRLISIRRLIVNVITPSDAMPEIEEDTDSKERSLDIRHVPSKSNDKMWFLSPSYLCDFLRAMLQTLLAYHFSYGAVLYERLGSIELCLDGEVRSSWNLAAMIRAIALADSKQEQWTKEVCETRASLGLGSKELEQEQPAAA